ncbi:MAG: UPF0182 family membrane protein [Actinomycetota bacterium]
MIGRIPRNRMNRARRRALIITVAIVAAIVIALGLISTFYTEVLWFHETGYGKVFWASIWTRLGLGLVFGVVFAALLLLNLWIVRKITNPARMFSVPDQILERYRATLQPYMKWGIIVAAILFGLFAGSGAATKWQQYLLFGHAQSFHQVDPVFHKDLSFYVFRLPFERFVFTWLFSSLVIITLIAAAGHYFMGGIRPQQRGERVAPEVRAHLSVLLGIIVLVKAWGYRLDQFNLLFSNRGPQVTGASYTDVHAQLPALKLLVIIALIISVLFFVNARFKNWLLPLGGIGLLVLTSIVAGGIWPTAVQRLSVTPNERLKEATYIQRNIDATRKAFGIQNVQVTPYSGTGKLDAKDVQQNQSTIENIRLWDPTVLINQYVTSQRIKPYYEFYSSADVDRYKFDTGLRQVMLAAREVHPGGLSSQAQTWLNTHLVYTHGNGVVASRVDRVTPDGAPQLIVQDIPPVSQDGGPAISEPRIYYGEHEETPFVVVDTKQQELDYPQGGSTSTGYAQYTYDGTGGVRLSNFLKRAAFAWRFRDVNLLISSAITTDSRLMFRRVVPDRVSRVLPFIQLDSDPYIAIIGGRLKWIVDGYTSTAMYPYSQRINFGTVSGGSVSGGGNYIRNSVKVVVDAKNGTIDAYAWDATDPILQAWMKIFPGIMKPKSEMSADLLAHIRYPEGLFKLQTDRYANYHMTNASDFYSKQDAWLVANDPTQTSSVATQPMPPYYVLMKLPDGTGLEFVLVRPFTPVGRSNLSGYMVARSDPADYGTITDYVFPPGGTTFGPEQVEAQINQDALVAQQITLWNQQNSKVIYGNILLIPIRDSLLYVQPLYLQGQGANIPELKRVVAVTGSNVKMGDTLDQALAAIFGKAAPSPIEGPTTPGGKTVKDLIAEALAHDQKAQEALKNGDFATYGAEITLERQALQQAAAAAGASPSPSPSASPSQ